MRLVGYPVQLGLAVAEHVEEWMREFRLMALSTASSDDDDRDGEAVRPVPERLQAMVRVLTTRYAGELSGPDRARAEAAARGQATVDLEYPLRPETEQVVLGWQAMLVAVDEFCGSEDLLTLQRPPEQVALQEWLLGEFLRQARGEPPRPWAGPLAPAGA